MGSLLVVGAGPRLYLLDAERSRREEFPWGPDAESAARARSDFELPDALLHRLATAAGDVRSTGGRLRDVLAERTGRPVGDTGLGGLRAARSVLSYASGETEREFLRRVAGRALERALRSPDEIVIALAREEERLERAVGREERAAESFVPVAGSPLEEYFREWQSARSALASHHGRLVARLERESRARLPNLSAVVGARVAARLLAASGSLAALGRTSASRLQLLGARRRPSPDRGPRYGVLYRADRMLDVPAGRRPAYARTLAALAAIAARADASTRREISAPLLARRDRRIDALRRSR